MSEIIVAGAGHGGVTAAMLLSAAGHNVTVYEKCEKGETGLDQKDSLDAAALEYAGLEIPEEFNAPGNVITFVPLEDDVNPVTLPAPKNYRNLTVERREFIEWLIGLAENAGVKFVFGCAVKGPVFLGSRVAGIEADDGVHYADLVIDSAGVHSPLRKNLPAYFGIDREPAYYDLLHTYRAYFDRIPGVEAPENLYNIYVKEDGTDGFRWAITEEKDVDVLLVRFPEMNYSDVAQGLLAVATFNPHMDKNLVRGGKFADIPVRQPAAVLTADGYALIGDSAFMTYPVKGSGMAYAIKAGKILADTVMQDENRKFTAETLWEYQRRFFKEIGFGACRLAIIKNILPYMTADEINEVFKRGMVSSDELKMLTDGSLPKSRLITIVREKLKIMGDVPEFKDHMTDILGWFGRFAAVEATFPSKYSEEGMLKWAAKYNRFFDSIRKPPEENPEAE